MQFSFALRLLYGKIFPPFQNCLMVACDWQLSARTTVWQRDLQGDVISSSALSAFQRDLNSLRRVSDGLSVRKKKNPTALLSNLQTHLLIIELLLSILVGEAKSLSTRGHGSHDGWRGSGKDATFARSLPDSAQLGARSHLHW